MDIVKEKIGKRNNLCVARTLMSFVVKLVAFFRSLPLDLWRRQNNIHPSNLVEHNADSHSTAVETVSENCVRPCMERLQSLEKVVEELSNKPAAIPLEKEQMLMESLERIKSVELDLEKTKRVCLTLFSLDIWKVVINGDFIYNYAVSTGTTFCGHKAT